MNIIGYIESPFKEKFSIPRQPGLISVPMKIKICFPYNRQEAFCGLESFSHIWILFNFNLVSKDEEKLSVRPPRLGGNQKMGVFATRSPFRPNRIGLSVVSVQSVTPEEIVFVGGDFLDGTPVLDIKPYIKEIDSIPNAQSSWTDTIVNKKLNVKFEDDVDAILEENEKVYIEEILSLDPRPRFHSEDYKSYGSKLFNYDILWRVQDDELTVFQIIKLL